MSRAFIFPGQGAQYPGMGRDFYEQFPIARQTFEEANDLLKTDFSSLIFQGPAETLTLTKNSQLAIYIVSIALWRTFTHEFPHLKPAVCAGLSLGEYSALTASGKCSFEETLFVVKARAEYMQEACQKESGSMQVVLGLEPERVRAALPLGVWIANLNCPGQVVIAGKTECLADAAAALKAAGAKRVLPLEVSGAFHTPLMRFAEVELQPHIDALNFKESAIKLVMNTPGDFVEDVSAIRKNLIAQVTSPVLWEKGIRAMSAQGVTEFIEIGCGKTLCAMIKRIGIEGAALSIEKITDLEIYATSQK